MGTLGPCTYGGLVHEGYVHNPNCTPKVTNPIWIHLGVAHQHMENSPCADNFAENPWISIAMLCSVALLEGLKKGMPESQRFQACSNMGYGTSMYIR